MKLNIRALSAALLLLLSVNTPTQAVTGGTVAKVGLGSLTGLAGMIWIDANSFGFSEMLIPGVVISTVGLIATPILAYHTPAAAVLRARMALARVKDNPLMHLNYAGDQGQLAQRVQTMYPFSGTPLNKASRELAGIAKNLRYRAFDIKDALPDSRDFRSRQNYAKAEFYMEQARQLSSDAAGRSGHLDRLDQALFESRQITE